MFHELLMIDNKWPVLFLLLVQVFDICSNIHFGSNKDFEK